MGDTVEDVMADSPDTPAKDAHWPIPTRPFKFRRHQHVKHYKGGEYTIIGLPDEFVIEATREPAYAYRSNKFPTAPTVIRSQTEMEDGRFTLQGR